MGKLQIVINVVFFFLIIIGLSSSNDVDVDVDNVYFAQGTYHSYTSPLSINITLLDTYYNVTGFNITENYGFDMLGNSVRVNHGGFYNIMLEMSFYGGNSGIYEVELFVNDVAQSNCAFFRSTTSTNIGNGMITCIKELNVDDVLIVKVKDVGNPAQDIYIQQLSFVIIKI